MSSLVMCCCFTLKTFPPSPFHHAICGISVCLFASSSLSYRILMCFFFFSSTLLDLISFNTIKLSTCLLLLYIMECSYYSWIFFSLCCNLHSVAVWNVIARITNGQTIIFHQLLFIHLICCLPFIECQPCTEISPLCVYTEKKKSLLLETVFFFSAWGAQFYN